MTGTAHIRCGHQQRLSDAQAEAFRRAVDENKWYLSERAGRDVGLDVATEDFIRRFLDRFCLEFRLAYCQGTCPGRCVCELIAHIRHLTPYVRMQNSCPAPAAACDEAFPGCADVAPVAA